MNKISAWLEVIEDKLLKQENQDSEQTLEIIYLLNMEFSFKVNMFDFS